MKLNAIFLILISACSMVKLDKNSRSSSADSDIKCESQSATGCFENTPSWVQDKSGKCIHTDGCKAQECFNTKTQCEESKGSGSNFGYNMKGEKITFVKPTSCGMGCPASANDPTLDYFIALCQDSKFVVLQKDCCDSSLCSNKVEMPQGYETWSKFANQTVFDIDGKGTEFNLQFCTLGSPHSSCIQYNQYEDFKSRCTKAGFTALPKACCGYYCSSKI